MGVRARAHLHALDTQKSCAVGMRNAILWNHLRHAHSAIVEIKQSREYEVHTGRLLTLMLLQIREEHPDHILQSIIQSSQIFALKCLGIVKRY